MQSYKNHFIPLLPQLVERLVSGFEHSGFSIYLYVSTRLIREYAEGGPENAAACFGLVERMSSIMFAKSNSKKFEEMPDGKNCLSGCLEYRG